MKLKERRRGIFAETAATSDLAFILIIYYLVMAGFNMNYGFMINLPEKNSARVVYKEDLLRFEMDSKGVVFYQGAELDFSQTEKQIAAASADHPNLAVLLSVDGQAPWQNVVSFVEIAQKLDIEAFSFSIKDQS
ncbi:MAG: biopolymer transporter ExbD [Treponema sp.]|nr:biopolymer transporter ExbD [Treponema sp.]